MSIYAFEGAFLDACQLAMDLNGDSLPLFRQPNNERPAVLGIGLARNVLSLGQPVKNAGERGASMRQRSMQSSDARVARSGQMGKYVPFPLSNPETIQEDTNAVRGAMDFRNQAKRLSRHGNRMKLSFLCFAIARAQAVHGSGRRSGSSQSYRAASLCRRAFE
jgi:hypothetical protein